VREARVRPEYAAFYPALRQGEWAPAATVADRVVAGRLLRGGETLIRGRVLLDAHFEFRGGGSERGERNGVRWAAGYRGSGKLVLAVGEAS
jgi:hypothetical protein